MTVEAENAKEEIRDLNRKSIVVTQQYLDLNKRFVELTDRLSKTLPAGAYIEQGDPKDNTPVDIKDILTGE